MPDPTWDPWDDLTDDQREMLETYRGLLARYNRNVNLISPDTTGSIPTTHIGHCLAIARKAFPPGSRIVDWGTGGGLPAIPLAVRFPQTTVYAVDSVGKKVRAVRSMARRLGLDNCFPWHGRAEAWDGAAHYSVSRATAPLADLWHWHTRVADPDVPAAPEDEDVWAPGLICLKGGDLRDEIAEVQAQDPDVVVTQEPLPSLLPYDGLEEKVLLSVRRQ